MSSVVSQRPRLLVVDDDPAILRVIQVTAARVGYDVDTCGTGAEAMQKLLRLQPDLAMLDLRMPDTDGLDLLRQMKTAVPACEVILMTGFGGVDSAVEAIKRGAREYMTKPFEMERLRRVLVDIREELARRAHLVELESQVARQMEFCGMLGRSPAMQEVFSLIQRLAPHAKVVLITGETGTGKELAARAFHETGPRSGRRFITVNCSAVVDTLFESELFGHVRGAFTGAVDAKPGLFEAAEGGTLFLDEIGELPISAQAKLLRVLEYGEVQRVGSLTPRVVDVSVIAATNRDLRGGVAAGSFRGDLFYRLNVVGLALPPLRERREDIPYLTAAFIRDCASRMRKPIGGLTPGAERLLFTAPWDGNVRELKNAVERACILTQGPTITERELLPSLTHDASSGVAVRTMADGGMPAPLGDLERQHIVDVLNQVRGNRMRAAKVLGISRRALYRRLERYAIAGEVPARRPYLPPSKVK